MAKFWIRIDNLPLLKRRKPAVLCFVLDDAILSPAILKGIDKLDWQITIGERVFSGVLSFVRAITQQ